MVFSMLLDILGLRQRGIRKEFDQRVQKQLHALGKLSAFRIALERRKGRKAYEELLAQDDEFYVLHRGIAIAATWLSAISVSILNDIAVSENDADEEAPTEQAVALAFFSRLANDLWAIIELVERGFDIQARGLSRSFLEHIDVLICCIHDTELTEKFATAMDPEDANQFWHKHVSKNKMKRRVAELVNNRTGLIGSDIVESLRSPAEVAGSTILHPTMLAGLAAALGEEDVEYETYPIFPRPMVSSGGIYRTILVHLFWLLLLMGPLPKEPHGAWSSLIKNADIKRNRMLSALLRINQDMHGFMLEWHVTMKPTDDKSPSVNG